MRDNRLKTKLGSWEIDNPIIPTISSCSNFLQQVKKSSKELA